MKIKIIVSLVLLCVVFTNCKEGKAQKGTIIEIISVQDMEETLNADSVQLIDVRTAQEYSGGHIANAKNIVYQGEDWDVQVAALDKEQPVYVYCAKGGRSAKCASILEEAGFTKIFDLDGGITKWISEGYTVE